MTQAVSIRKNIFYSSILTISGYLFPLLTFPYVTRVLGVANLGICNYVDSIVQYFILFSMMGIGTTAIREVAKAKGNKVLLSRVFSSLLGLNLLFTFISIFILIICSLTIHSLASYKEMLYIGVAKVLFNSLLIEWFYKGLEDFRYITARSLIIRVLYVMAVFILVKSPKDYIVYFSLNVVVVVINALVNLYRSRYFVNFSFRQISFKPFLFPFIALGLYSLLTSLYTSFNVAYLGFTCGEVEVGYYTVSSKLFSLILALFTAFTGVLLPRMSSLATEGKSELFMIFANKSIDALLAFVIPLIVVSINYAPTIVRIVAGNGYEGSILPMKIIMPLMFIIGYEQILVVQILMPLKKDKAILINSFIGALVAVITNFLIVPTYKSIGAAIVWCVSEFIVMIAAQLFVGKCIGFHFPVMKIIKRIPIVIFLFLICFKTYNDSLICLILAITLSYIIDILYEYLILKNDLICKCLDDLLKKSNKK